MGRASPFHETDGDYRTEKFMEGGSSVLPLYSLQDSLPRLPLPTLEETFARYLVSIEPLADQEEYKATAAAAREFLRPGGLGERLQARLARRSIDRHDSSWLAEWWNKLGYLDDRGPTVFFVSYFYHFSDSPRAAVERTQTGRAAALIHAALLFRRAVFTGRLPPEKVGKKGVPLCSTAYKYMFNACRVPGEAEDRVRLFPAAGNHHILVIRRNRFFVVHVTDAEGQPLSHRDIQLQLQAVVDLAGPAASESAPPSRPVGVLTSWGRPEWAKAREQLVADGNEELLERAEAAALTVCLDDHAPQTRSDVARALWHGDGRNRHFDKSVQIVVFRNGKAGLVGEHSMMDGMPTLRLADFMMKKTMGFSADSSAGSDSSPESWSPVAVTPPRPLDLALSPASLRAIASAEVAFDRLVNQHEMDVLEFTGYGANTIKKFKISPDAFVQMALQLAVFKMTGEMWATYEPAQVRKFLHGRTACVRSLSSAAKDWVLSMEDEGDRRPTPHRLGLLRRAAESHIEYARSAAEGKDVDRHLFGLQRVLAADESCSVFTDPVFSRSKHWRMSTSHLTHEQFDGWGWGEVVPDGVGVAYSIKKSSLLFTVACRRRPEGWSSGLCHHLQEALLDMRALCEHADGVGSKL
ncbi:Carnitine/choline O-acyltransferase [Ectocarpus siliculosus]|uniref:Carnitine O-acetyltransferase, mitochondrial n=1 Tax=Ectocarpus siliculosus TaxID=2880 RepID=D8LEZ7_ECTSI|nr:Carnitine/choline O-acyltransferase [Ectocarpus siliculosus]|eukprot:CBN79817.1 Carnitine/choline O-acyltransferase [Ectocarpus siliculosus]